MGAANLLSSRMGQQQLLLLVLGVVLVGLAVVTGIQTFQEQKRKVSQDQAIAEAARLGTLMIAWKMTPPQLGGGQGGNTWGRLKLSHFGLGIDKRHGSQYDIKYGLEDMTNSSNTRAPYVTALHRDDNIEAAAFVYGPDARCIATRLAIFHNPDQIGYGPRTYLPAHSVPNPDPDRCSWDY